MNNANSEKWDTVRRKEGAGSSAAKRSWCRGVWLVAAVFALSTVSMQAEQTYSISLNSPTIDKMVYPFSPLGGGPRTSGLTFGAIGSDGFDDRDAQLFTLFDTTSIVPRGLGASNYVILSATFRLQIATGGAVVFDGTYDPISTYGPTGAPINGDDPGRPFELYGAGFRNGVTSATLSENLAFKTAEAPSEGGRSIFATDFHLGVSINGANRDVSNNVANGFDPVPFAIGQVAPGDLTNGLVDEDANVVFTLNLANPDVVRYLQLSLDDGRVSFLTTSLHQGSQGGAVTYPEYYTKENLLGGLPGRLDIQVQVVPEPSPVTLVFLGFGVMVACWRGGRAFRKGAEELS